MLKHDYDIICASFETWLFQTRSAYLLERSFGIKKKQQTDVLELFLISELMDFIKLVNKNRNPANTLIIPISVGIDNFNRIISNVKNIIR